MSIYLRESFWERVEDWLDVAYSSSTLRLDIRLLMA